MSEELRQYGQKSGWLGLQLPLVSPFLGTLCSEMTLSFATNFQVHDQEQAREPRVRCSGLLLPASRGNAFLRGYVGSGLSCQEKGKTEAEEPSDEQRGLRRWLSLGSNPVSGTYEWSDLAQSLCALVSLSIKWG